jgi:hypothetical protein
MPLRLNLTLEQKRGLQRRVDLDVYLQSGGPTNGVMEFEGTRIMPAWLRVSRGSRTAFRGTTNLHNSPYTYEGFGTISAASLRLWARSTTCWRVRRNRVSPVGRSSIKPRKTGSASVNGCSARYESSAMLGGIFAIASLSIMTEAAAENQMLRHAS